MTKILSQKSLDFNNVHIIADKPSIVSSRDKVHINPNRIIVAPMSAIMGPKLVKAAVETGLSVPIHRFNTIQEQTKLLDLAIITKELMRSESHLWISVGMTDWYDRIKPIKHVVDSQQIGILLDVANGFSTDVKEVLEKIRDYTGNSIGLFAGNVHSPNGFAFLDEIGCEYVRVGVGNGAACQTTDVTGIGKGQFSAVLETNTIYRNANLVSDGGIRSSSDAAKAFGAGADYVMIGGMFSSAAEAECNQIVNGVFYGGASARAKSLMGLPIKHIEGKEIPVAPTGVRPLSEIVKELLEGLRSTISYAGYNSLEDFVGSATFQIKA